MPKVIEKKKPLITAPYPTPVKVEKEISSVVPVTTITVEQAAATASFLGVTPQEAKTILQWEIRKSYERANPAPAPAPALAPASPPPIITDPLQASTNFAAASLKFIGSLAVAFGVIVHSAGKSLE